MTDLADLTAFEYAQPPVRLYLIWSNEHRAWWAPAELGYTTVIEAAGRYTETEARRIVDKATQDHTAPRQYWIAHKGRTISAFDEWMVPAPAALPPLPI